METIVRQIIEGAQKFLAEHGALPKFIFVGGSQSREIDAVLADMISRGLMVKTGLPWKRRSYEGMEIFRVDADNHLSFGS